jgi:hypothetical protein
MIRTRRLLIPAVLAGAAVTALAAPVATAAEGRAAMPPRQEEILSKLANMKISVDFTDAALPDVLDFIRSFSGIDFVMDLKVRERLGDEQMKVSLKVNDLPLRSTLRILLAGKGLTAVYREGVLVIVPKEEADKDVVLRIYDVRDLMMKIEDHPGPVIELRPPQAGTGGIIINLGEEKPPPSPEFMVDMIKRNCGGATWDNPNASISLNGGLLMVSQSPKVHLEVVLMIDKLRQYK